MCTHATVSDQVDGSAKGPAARVAVELTRDSATRLVRAIEAALAAAPEGL